MECKALALPLTSSTKMNPTGKPKSLHSRINYFLKPLDKVLMEG